MGHFPNIDEIQEILEDIVEDIPEEFFDGLNGGIVLEEDIKYHPDSQEGRPLYVLGEYVQSVLGKHIVIYYGSLKRVYQYEYEFLIYEKIREVLIHEFIHHLETRAGEIGLRLEDREALKEYLDKYGD